MKNKLQVFLITLLAFNLSELTRACDPPDCNRPDCGTCANACCTLEFYFGIVFSLALRFILVALCNYLI